MLIIILMCTISLNNYCYCDNDTDLNININDNTFEIERLLYGDILNIKDMFLPLDEKDSDIEDKEPPATVKPQILDFEYLKPIKGNQDITEFNEITKDLNNLTRRYRGRYHGWYDPEEPREWKYWWRPAEYYKITKMLELNIQHLIHSRYQIKKALDLKQVIRTDKRYKLGYLFNRLKRIKFEQQKIVSYANEQIKSNFRDLTSQIRLYEKMVRYDVDIVDTIKWIQELDKEDSKMIYIPEIKNIEPLHK